MIFNTTKYFAGFLSAGLLGLFTAAQASAAISFVSATNSLNLVETKTDGEEQIFVFGGIADGDSAAISFSIDSECPDLAMTGGAEFTEVWSCAGGVISATVTNRGGMSFGPATEDNAGTFYVTFSNVPTPPGLEAPPAALSGIQISVFGDVSRWDLSGETSETGVTFGIELSGTQGGAANFRMLLPSEAVDYLGGVIGVSVGGKPDPFATVTTNEDGSVALKVDIAKLSGTASASRFGAAATQVTKKITAGARELSVSFNKTAIKSGKSVALAMCSGTEFTAGDKVQIKFTGGGKAKSLKKSFTLGENGCAATKVTLKAVSAGTLTAKISYNGDKASAKVKVTK